MKTTQLVIFSVAVSLAAAANAASPMEVLLNSADRAPAISGMEIPAPVPVAAEKSAGAYSMVEHDILMARMASNTLKTIAIRLRGLEQAAPAEYTRGIQETSADIEESVAELELALKAGDAMALRTEVSRMTPMIERLNKLAASIETSPNYNYWSGKDVKRLAGNFNIYLLSLQTYNSFMAVNKGLTKTYRNNEGCSVIKEEHANGFTYYVSDANGKQVTLGVLKNLKSGDIFGFCNNAAVSGNAARLVIEGGNKEAGAYITRGLAVVETVKGELSSVRVSGEVHGLFGWKVDTRIVCENLK